MKTTKIKSEANSTAAKVFGLVLSLCICTLAVSLTAKIVLLLFT